MSTRLDIELGLRRHGRGLVIAAVGLLAAAVLLLRTMGGDLATGTPIVQAADGGPRLEANLRAFRHTLVNRQQVEARQHALLERAVQHGLVPGRIDYGFEMREGSRFGIATLQMPLRGNYVDFRGFLAAALAAEPALVLEDLAVRRDVSGSGIEASVRFGLYADPGLGGRT